MKIELTKETTFQGVFFWVKADETASGPSKCFHSGEEERAKEYLNSLAIHYEKYGNFDNVSETVISKEVTYKPSI